ncbi:MAG: hypothetical protein R3C05_10925 [Pirellulaceae bacterium]
MDPSSLVVGALMLLAAGVLQWRDASSAKHQDSQSELDERYHVNRTRGRRWVHVLLAICGLLAITAGAVGHGQVFILCWASVPLVLLVIVILAMLDAFRTYQYHAKKLPELRKSSFPEIDSENDQR